MTKDHGLEIYACGPLTGIRTASRGTFTITRNKQNPSQPDLDSAEYEKLAAEVEKIVSTSPVPVRLNEFQLLALAGHRGETRQN